MDGDSVGPPPPEPDCSGLLTSCHHGGSGSQHSLVGAAIVLGVTVFLFFMYHKTQQPDPDQIQAEAKIEAKIEASLRSVRYK